MAKRKLKIATVNNPVIEAVIGEMFYFQTKLQAEKKMLMLREHFISAKKQQCPKCNKEDIPHFLRLWIKGFDISHDEQQKGYTGNFANIYLRIDSDKLYTLYAEKDVAALTAHPQRKRPKRRHPDWGHPVLRSVKSNVHYDNMEEATDKLRQLYEEYSDIVIPLKNKLFIIIYGKVEGQKNPTQKYILEIKQADNNRFYIDYRLNIKPTTKQKTTNQAASPKGKFTSMVQLKRGGKI